jgi:3-hydroxy-D-aspartate aldolase
MDADYGRNLDRDGAPTKAFAPSLFVWATVMSRPTDDRAIVDAGLKALAFDSGPALCDEHGRLGIKGATNRLSLGDKIRLGPGHCDPTVNLYDWYVAIRGNRVEQLLADHRPRRGVLTAARSLEAEHRDPVRSHEPVLRAENHPLQVCLGD